MTLRFFIDSFRLFYCLCSSIYLSSQFWFCDGGGGFSPEILESTDTACVPTCGVREKSHMQSKERKVSIFRRFGLIVFRCWHNGSEEWEESEEMRGREKNKSKFQSRKNSHFELSLSHSAQIRLAKTKHTFEMGSARSDQNPCLDFSWSLVLISTTRLYIHHVLWRNNGRKKTVFISYSSVFALFPFLRNPRRGWFFCGR